MIEIPALCKKDWNTESGLQAYFYFGIFNFKLLVKFELLNHITGVSS